MSPIAQGKLSSGIESALVAKWSIVAAVVSDKLYEAFLQGAFATPQSSLEYIHDNWWMLLITGLMSGLTGAYVRTQQKMNYIGRVEAGTAAPSTNPVVVPSTTTVIQPPASGPTPPAPPAQGNTP